MRILVAGTPWPMSTFVERLVVGLSRRGHHVTLRTRDRPPTTWQRDRGVDWRAAGGRDRVTFVRALRRGGLREAAVTAVHAAGRRGEDRASWDVVYVPWLNALVDEPELFDLGLPVVTSCRGALVTIAPWDPERPEHGVDLQAVFARSTLVHCVSDAIAAEAGTFGLAADKVRVVRPAVDPSAFVPTDRPPTASGAVKALAVGSLIWRKDYESALLAVAESARRGVDISLDIIGEGPDEQHLRFVVDDLDLGDRVRLRGHQPPAIVAEALTTADIFLHTSSSEGISNAVLEAMASGLPVITTNTGGMAEAVREGTDGYLVDVRDTSAMAERLVALADDAELRRRMGAAARRRVLDGFHLADQVASFEALLAEAGQVEHAR